MNLHTRYLAAMCISLALGLVSHIVKAEQLSSSTSPSVIKLEETIRGDQEQPKVLTIVPWQPPKTKQALPSDIVERINKQFVPLQREELKRQIKILDSKNTYPNS